ncbi:hypothetical protein ACHAWF_010621 [Thalassiosira exigua]
MLPRGVTNHPTLSYAHVRRLLLAGASRTTSIAVHQLRYNNVAQRSPCEKAVSSAQLPSLLDFGWQRTPSVTSFTISRCRDMKRMLTTAYQGTPSDGKHGHQLLEHLIPYRATLKDGRHVEVDFFRHYPSDIEEDEWFAGMALMNLVIREGRSWPFEEDFSSVEDWRGYFLSHTAFVVRALDNGMDAAKRNSSSQGEILGCFYIKPNFPGLMGNIFLRAARDLGYKSSYFNLVFKSNGGSVKLWESLGFQRVATLEKAARLEGLGEGELDTAYGYRYDLETLPADYLGLGKPFEL